MGTSDIFYWFQNYSTCECRKKSQPAGRWSVYVLHTIWPRKKGHNRHYAGQGLIEEACQLNYWWSSQHTRTDSHSYTAQYWTYHTHIHSYTAQYWTFHTHINSYTAQYWTTHTHMHSYTAQYWTTHTHIHSYTVQPNIGLLILTYIYIQHNIGLVIISFIYSTILDLGL